MKNNSARALPLAFSLAVALPALAQTTQPASQPSTQPTGPSIILLLAGDQAVGMTGFEGNTSAKTPNLDRLVAEGTWFSRCYAPAAQSAPAKASILTGQYPHTHGVDTDGPALKSEADTFTARLKKDGYACGFVGEWNLPEAGSRNPGFGLTDYVATDDGQWLGAETWTNGKKDTTKDYLTDWQTDRAIEFVDKFQDRPFFLWVSFRAPGEPFQYPPGTASRQPPDDLKLPDTADADRNGWPNKLRLPALTPIAKRYDEKKKDGDALRADRAMHLAAISRMDEGIGRILKQVDDLGLREKTVVVFACCNGLALGDHGLYGKGPLFYEELVRGPLVVRWPALAAKGAKTERVVGLVDLAPTILQLAGQRKPFAMQGDSLVPLLKNPRDTAHGDEAFFEYERQTVEGDPGQTAYICQVRGLVTKNYKYIEYLDDSYILYDLKRDPAEMNNLAARIATDGVYHRNYNPVFQVVKERLNRWRRQTHDPTWK